MAITFVDFALGATNSTTTFSITLPTTQAGDLIILEYVHRATGDGTIGGTYTGAAFQQKKSQPFGPDLYSGHTLWSIATGNHSGQTVTGSGLTNSCAAIVTIYRGAHQTTPLDDATVVGEQNASGNETQAEISNATAGAWIVLCVVNSPDLAVSSQACTTPGTLTERAERLSTGGTDSSIAHASAEKSGAGGTGAFTWSQTDAASGSWAYAIKPQPANHALDPSLITLGTVSLSSPAVAQNHVLTPSALILGAQVLAAPELTQDHVLTPSALTLGAVELASPTLAVFENYVLTPALLTLGAMELSSPALTQDHALTPSALLLGAIILSEPALLQVHALSPDSLLLGAITLSSPALTQDHALVTDALLLGAMELSSPALFQVHLLTPDSLLIGGIVLATPVLAEETGNHDLTPSPLLLGAVELATPILTQVHVLTPSGLLIGPISLSTPALVEGIFAVGKVFATISAARPDVIFSAAHPHVVITGSLPVPTFEGE